MTTTAGLDPLQSPLLAAELPGLRTALDGEAILGHVQAALRPRHAIARSTPGQATYLGGAAVVRYRLESEGDPPSAALVTGRLFADRDACARYVEERLAPLAEAARGREELDLFATPVGVVEPLCMALQVFPVDGELPTLVEATDRRRMLGVLGQALPAAGGGGLVAEDCRVELGHYGRQHRCVLRYHVDTRAAGDGARRQLLAQDGRWEFGVPRCLGYLPDLQLALFEAIPGVPQVAQLLKARIQGRTGRGAEAERTLQEMGAKRKSEAPRYYLAEYLLRHGRRDEAIAILNDMLLQYRRGTVVWRYQERKWYYAAKKLLKTPPGAKPSPDREPERAANVV